MKPRSLLWFTVAAAMAATPTADDLARDRALGALELVARFDGPMLTGVTVSREGRIFVNFPRWGDPVEFTVAELRNGKAVAYPDAAINRLDMARQSETLVSVQSVVVDPRNRLWILDTGSPMFAKTSYGGPKLIGVDLASNKIVKKILFPPDVATPDTYLNDVRFDLKRRNEGMAFITDSGGKSANGIIVVDLASGKSWRHLANHPSVKADPNFVAQVEGEQVWQTDAAGTRTKWAMGSDGIAISPDGETLYYCPLSSRHLFSVSVDDLADPNGGAKAVASVKDLGEKGASDGLESDQQGRVYAGDYESNSVRRRRTDGTWETLAHDPRILWPDTLAVVDGAVYFTANQLHRQKQFHAGQDLRQKPYALFRLRTNSTRIATR